MPIPRYAIITPCHNEGKFLPVVTEAVRGQAILPRQWVVLDDRSSDGTWANLKAVSERVAWVTPVKIEGDEGRQVGPNVVHLFHLGLTRISEKVDFVVKLDADVILPPRYFEELLDRFAADPGLGLASGKTYIYQEGQWVLERIAHSHVTGACKTYRRQCLEDMGGLIPVQGWDVLDVVQARLTGWRTRSFRDLHLYHLRPTGSAQGMARANLSYGRSYYAMRAHPLFVVAKSLYRACENPYLLGLLILAGYLKAALRRERRLPDMVLTRYLRQAQLHRLLGRTWQEEVLAPQRLRREGGG